MLGDVDASAGRGMVAIIFWPSLLNLSSSQLRHSACSGLLNGSQMNEPIGLAGVHGGIFSLIGTTELEQEVWTAVMMVQESATVSPMSLYAISIDSTFQWVAERPQTNAVTDPQLWSRMTTATTTDSERIRHS